MLGVAIQSFIRHQWMAGTLQLIISLGFLLLLVHHILALRDQKQGCSSAGCGTSHWVVNLFKKREN